MFAQVGANGTVTLAGKRQEGPLELVLSAGELVLATVGQMTLLASVSLTAPRVRVANGTTLAAAPNPTTGLPGVPIRDVRQFVVQGQLTMQGSLLSLDAFYTPLLVARV